MDISIYQITIVNRVEKWYFYILTIESLNFGLNVHDNKIQILEPKTDWVKETLKEET